MTIKIIWSFFPNIASFELQTEEYLNSIFNVILEKATKYCRLFFQFVLKSEENIGT